MKVKISLILIFALISSCASRKEVLYFQFDNINRKCNNNYSTIFKADDLPQINVSSSDIEAVKPFNLSAVSYALSSDRVIGELLNNLI